MRRPTVLILALALSLLAHAIVLSLPGWRALFGRELDEPAVLHARLVVPEPKPAELVPLAPAPVPVVPPKPKPAPAPQPAVVPPTAPATEAVALAVPADAGSGAGPADGAAPAVAPPAAPQAGAPGELAAAAELPGFSIAGWPARGSIRFRVQLGEGGLAVGEAEHEWAHDGKRYRMSVAVRTTGIVGLFREFHYAQRSEGGVGRDGLRPERFRVEQTRKTPASAVFDWTARQVTMKRGRKERVAALRPGDQDLLSLWHQIGIVGAAQGATELNVITGRAATPSTVEVMGPETVALPIGQLETLRVRAEARDGSLTIDIWLARNYGMLPVRIRVVDDKGEVLDQQAIELRLSPPGAAAVELAAGGMPDGAEGTPDGAADASDAAQTAETEMIELRAEDNAAAHLTSGN